MKMVARVKRIQEAKSELKEFYNYGEKIPCVHNMEKIENIKKSNNLQGVLCEIKIHLEILFLLFNWVLQNYYIFN